MSLKIVRFAIFILLMATISGCSSKFTRISRGIDNVDFSGKGLIVGSIQETTDGMLPSSTSFFIHSKEDGSSLTLATNNVFWWQFDDFRDMENSRGGVFAIALPPGDYYVHGWNISSGNSYMFPKHPRKAPFTVHENEVLYIGNLNMLIKTGHNIFGMELVASGFPFILDESVRDFVFLKWRYPFLNNRDIKIEIAKYDDLIIPPEKPNPHLEESEVGDF